MIVWGRETRSAARPAALPTALSLVGRRSADRRQPVCARVSTSLAPHTTERLELSAARRHRRYAAGEPRPAGDAAAPARPLVILIHGLTGSEDSLYLLTMARLLLDRGGRVLRLNLRGAGPSRAAVRPALLCRPQPGFPHAARAVARRTDARRHRGRRLLAGRRDAAEISRRRGCGARRLRQPPRSGRRSTSPSRAAT